MIDPDNMIIQRNNLSSTISIITVPEFDTQCYNLDDDKDYNKFIGDIESRVRKSFEYKQFIRYLREYMGMSKCAVLKNVSNEESYDIKIEIHHYPFTLRDISEIVYRKRCYYNESVELQMIAKEVMELHYKAMVGLIPLSETVHKLYHNGRLFIPVDKVFGRYKLFVDYYKPFIDPAQLETLERIESYTENNNIDVLDSTIIEQNRVSYNVNDKRFALPAISTINDNMIEQINAIKNNNYLLPGVSDSKIEKTKDIEIICPIEFDYTLIKK